MMRWTDDSPSEPEEALSSLSRTPPWSAEQRMRTHLCAFREALPLLRPKRGPFRDRLTILRGATVAAAFLLFAAGMVFLLDGGFQPTWAEVVERASSMPFVSATVYVKPGATEAPAQVELWMGKEGRARLRVGNEMIFGENGRFTERVVFEEPAEDSERLRRAQQMMEDAVKQFVSNLSQADRFTFNTFMQCLPMKGQLTNTLENQEAGIGRDLVAFDMTNSEGPDWMRIWALRESRLPVRVLYWDPRSGQSVDAFISYASEQPDRFFDPEAYRRVVEADGLTGGAAAYALLQDPGGQRVTMRATPHAETPADEPSEGNTP